MVTAGDSDLCEQYLQHPGPQRRVRDPAPSFTSAIRRDTRVAGCDHPSDTVPVFRRASSLESVRPGSRCVRHVLRVRLHTFDWVQH